MQLLCREKEDHERDVIVKDPSILRNLRKWTQVRWRENPIFASIHSPSDTQYYQQWRDQVLQVFAREWNTLSLEAHQQSNGENKENDANGNDDGSNHSTHKQEISTDLMKEIVGMTFGSSGLLPDDFLFQFMLYPMLQGHEEELLAWLIHHDRITITSLKMFCEWICVCNCVWTTRSFDLTDDSLRAWLQSNSAFQTFDHLYRRLCIYEAMTAEEPFSIPRCLRDSSYYYQVIAHHLTCRNEKQNQLAIALLKYYPVSITYALYEKRMTAVLSSR